MSNCHKFCNRVVYFNTGIEDCCSAVQSLLKFIGTLLINFVLTCLQIIAFTFPEDESKQNFVGRL